MNEEQDYTVSISTELDGKTITQVVMKATKDDHLKKSSDSKSDKDKGKDKSGKKDKD